MHYETFNTTDGCLLAFQTSLPLTTSSPSTTGTPSTASSPSPSYSTCILLLHGFSGSSAYFTRNYPTLTPYHWVLAPDLRGHGRSGHNPSRGGYHIARLAADLRELLLHVRNHTSQHTATNFIPVGCSIGAAVVWTYIELFGEDPFAGHVFVDQAPLQDRSQFGGKWGEGLAHKGCFDERSMLGAQEAWIRHREEAQRGLVMECLGYWVDAEWEGGKKVGEGERRRDEEFFTGVSRVCDGVWLARLIADHTRYDHREAIEGIGRPVLVMAGRRSGCFTLEGMEETVRRVRKGGRGRQR